ncbi:MAG: hypothetical protein RRB22_13180 [Gammaproteobacteria bacterium]|nr:hypothetical protein [Gammaproteobacteria bacterium]
MIDYSNVKAKTQESALEKELDVPEFFTKIWQEFINNPQDDHASSNIFAMLLGMKMLKSTIEVHIDIDTLLEIVTIQINERSC